MGLYLLARSLGMVESHNFPFRLRSLCSFVGPSQHAPDEDTTTLKDKRLQLHNNILSLLHSRKLDEASSKARAACDDARRYSKYAFCRCQIAHLYTTAAHYNCTCALRLRNLNRKDLENAPFTRAYQTAQVCHGLYLDAIDHLDAAIKELDHALNKYTTSTACHAIYTTIKASTAAYRATHDAFKATDAALTIWRFTANPAPNPLPACSPTELRFQARSESLDAHAMCRSAVETSREGLDPSNSFPSVFTCNALTTSFLSTGRHQDVIDLHKFFFSDCKIIPTVDSYRILTKALVGTGHINEAMDMLREMIYRGHGADSIVYNNLIAGYINLNNMDKALELLSELKDNNAIYDGIIHATMIEGFFKMGMDEKAMETYQCLLDRRSNMTADTCNLLLQTLLNHDKLEDANKLFARMLDWHTHPNFDRINYQSYNIMIDHLVKAGKFVEAIKIFDTVSNRPSKVNIGCYNNLIRKLCENQMTGEAIKLFHNSLQKWIKSDADTYGYIIYGCLFERRTRDSLEYFTRLVHFGRPKVNVGLSSKLFDGLGEVGFIAHAMKAGLYEF